jgi:hypothetical protein
MMLLQIVPNLFSQFCASAMEDNAYHQWRGVQQDCNFFVVETFVITQDKHLARSLSEPRNSLANKLLQFSIGVQCFGAATVAGTARSATLIASSSAFAGVPVGQPSNATIAPTTTNSRSDEAIKSPVVPRLEMYALPALTRAGASVCCGLDGGATRALVALARIVRFRRRFPK